MKFKIFYLCLIVLYSCQPVEYKPDGLRKLNDAELIERAKQRIFDDVNAITFKNQKGEVLSIDALMKIPDQENWAMDIYVDESGQVKEKVIRKATEKDVELREKLETAANHQPPLELLDIDCTQTKELLQRIYDSDQGMRTEGGTLDPSIDKENLIQVISLIEQCGMPRLDEVGEEPMNAIWFVLQHGDNANRKRYLPILKEAALNGDLKSTQIAMMEDRILMLDGKPQVYGTQVIQKDDDDQWILYELESPESVDKRRKKVGFSEPLAEYLKRLDIKFDVVQKE